MPFQVDTLKNEDGTGGPILTGLSTVSGNLEVTGTLDVSGNTTISGAMGVTGILTAPGADISGVTTIATYNPGTISVGGSITVGKAFIQNRSVGLGQTDTTGRDAGVGTATGTLVYNETTVSVQVYDGTQWIVTGKQ